MPIRHYMPIRSRQPSNLNACRNTARAAFPAPAGGPGQLVSVLRGQILDVAVDVRRGSPTFGKHVSTKLSAETGRQLYIPAGFAHGYLTLQGDVVIMYKVS